MIILVDLVLSGDNAIVIGMAAASLPPKLQNKAIAYGITAAILFRIPLAALTFYLLEIVGLKLIGGGLLFFVCYQLWIDLSKNSTTEIQKKSDDVKVDTSLQKHVKNETVKSRQFFRAMTTILVADLTMSLDNVLAVAGVARDNIEMLIFGLVLSIILMAVGATVIARLLNKYAWIGYIGLAVIIWVAGNLTWDGSVELIKHFNI
jgi:YjbE family integral membrane protein